MDESLGELIREVKSENGHGYPLITIVSGSRFHVRNEQLSKFWEDYCKLLRDEDILYGVGEPASSQMPLTVEGVITYDSHPDADMIPEEFIIFLVQTYQHVMEENLSISPGKYELLCVYLKSGYFNDEKS